MMSIVRPLTDKVRQSHNSNITVIEKTALNLNSKSVLPSVSDFCSTLKVRISTLDYRKRFAHIYPVPQVVTWPHQSIKERFSHDKNRDINDDSHEIPSDGIPELPDNPLESEEKLSINVLLVDNDQDILFTFKSMLEAEGYHVESFADPTEALARFVQMDPSYYKLVLTDIRMPNLNGFQLYQKLREVNSDIRVLFMTAFDVPANLHDTMPTIKDSDIIKKPIEDVHFVNIIKNAINLE